jgi:chromosome segregation protein
MTKINKMIMKGFKSFAKRTEIVFGDKFNCVLGPNGSGKSNVLDALCFVLGRGSAKSLRAEKSANLIYNGGKTKKPAKEGEVSIYFDNTKSTFPLDEKEIKVTRVIKDTGQSVYKINDKRRTRTEILELLGGANIDPDGYNIILQGDIVQLVEMNSVERRKIIEEIAGIGVYEEKKEKALREIDRVQERLNESEIILTERGAYLKELKKERDQALKFKELKDKLHVSKASYLFKKMEKRLKEKEKYEKQIKEHEEKLAKTDDRVKKLKEEIEEKKKRIEEVSHEIEHKGEKDQVSLHKEVEQLKVDIATDKSKIENYENEINRVKQRVSELEAELEEHKGKTKALEDRQQDLLKFKAGKEKEMELVAGELEKFRKKNSLDNAGEIDKEINALDAEIEAKEKDMHAIREEQQNLLREKDKIEYQLQTMDDKIDKILEVEKENKAQVESLKSMKATFKKTTLELNQCLNEDSTFSSRLGANRKNLLEEQERLAKLNARNASIRESVASDRAVSKILELKKKISGIYGTVSELGNVSKKFSMALEIAAGSKIKDIVVENDKVASECIKYLKTNKLGVATFLPLNKIKEAIARPEVKKLASSKGVHGFALDLIKFEPRFKKVFSYVFGNVLVVEDIDTARSIGIGAAKMVTLDGDLADISGAMKGGFRHPKRLGLGFKENEVVKELKECEKSIADLENVVSVLEKKRTENEKKIVELRQAKANLEGEIIKLEKALHLESDDLDMTKTVKKDLNKNLETIDKQLREVQNKVSEMNRELAQMKIKKQNLRAKVSQLSNPRLVAELNAFEQKKTQIRETLIKAESDLQNIETQIKVVAPDREKIVQILKQHSKEEEKFEAEIKVLKDKLKNGNIMLEKKEKQAKEFYAKYKELFNKRSKLNDEVNKAQNTIEGMRENSRQSEVKMNLISLENAKIKAELVGLEEDFKQYEGVELDKSKDVEQLKSDIYRWERAMQNMDAVNMKALEIYEGVEKQYNVLVEKREQLIKEKEDVLMMIDEIEGKKKGLFVQTLEVVNKNFQDFFLKLSTKGQAFLKLENPESPFEDGLRIMVRLTGTKFMDIRSLSGGEKTMTALAFLFAVQEHKPHSFYVMDEVDAALDKHNSQKLAELVRNYCDNAQYVVISHNDAVISEADNLYGVSMNEHGMTQVVSLKI